MNNILVAVELDEHSKDLVDYAAKIARAFEAKVWIVHIAESEPEFIGHDQGPQYIRDVLAGQFREEHRQVQALCKRFEQDAIEVEGLMVQGPTVKMILEEAEKLEVDLIITASHKHSFLYRAFMGSVSRELFDRSNIPLLVYPVLN